MTAAAAALAAALLAGYAPAVHASRPQLLAPPHVTATAGLLALTTGRWDQPQAPLRIQWQRCTHGRCVPIVGANGRVWEPQAQDVGHTMRATVTASSAGLSRTATTTQTRPIAKMHAVIAQPSDPVIDAAGDIACAPEEKVTPTSCHQAQTAALLNPAAAAILMLGDSQYECGASSAFTSFDQTWGRFKLLIRPVVGNHEYQPGPGCPGDATPYFNYFGTAAGEPDRGWYSFDLGGWHLVALNSECAHVACGVGSPQEAWLRTDLAQTSQPCILAYWHEPRFVHTVSAPVPPMAAVWADLYKAHADVVLNGHLHEYARFAASDPSGRPSAHGMRQFIVGTGGRDFYPGTWVRPSSLVAAFQDTTFGVLQLRLHGAGYDWRFLPEKGRSFTDTGGAVCNAK